MFPVIPFPAALNHPTPNLKPHLGWLASPVVMPTHLVEGPIDADGGHFAIFDGDGELTAEVWVDAIPGLDVYAEH